MDNIIRLLCVTLITRVLPSKILTQNALCTCRAKATCAPAFNTKFNIGNSYKYVDRNKLLHLSFENIFPFGKSDNREEKGKRGSNHTNSL